MRTDIPVFQRCCGCIPLRYGLIVWGYLRLVFASFLLFGASFAIAWLSHRSNETSSIVVLSLIVLLLIADLVLGIIFIVGCHKKDATLMKKYYHYNQFLLGILLPLGIYNFISTIYYTITISGMKPGFLILDIFLEFISYMSYAVIQIYIMLLVRSEINKLNNNSQFRFENRVPAAECSLNIEGSSEENTRSNKEEEL